MFTIFSLGPAAIEAKRRQFISTLERWAVELEPKEREIKASMHPAVRVIMEKQRIALIKRLVNHFGFKDDFLVKDLVAGFKLVGCWRSVVSFLKQLVVRRPVWRTS